jgi:hypothetical protein
VDELERAIAEERALFDALRASQGSGWTRVHRSIESRRDRDESPPHGNS